MSSPDDLLRGLRPPRPPAALRRRVLEAALASAGSGREPWIDRLWHSRIAHQLWLAATLLLASLHVALLPTAPARPGGAASAAVSFVPTSLEPRSGPPLGGIEDQIRLAETILLANSPRRGS